MAVRTQKGEWELTSTLLACSRRRVIRGRTKGSGIRSVIGFTLIELLVVIAVISILAAILFPVFARAKAAAKQATCLSNQRQLVTASDLYLNDFDDTYPWSYSWTTDAYLAQLLDPYAKTYQASSAGLWACPSSNTNAQSLSSNAQVIGLLDLRAPGPIATAFSYVPNASQVQSPSDIVLFGDGITEAGRTPVVPQNGPRSSFDFAFPHPATKTDHTDDPAWSDDWLDLPINNKQVSNRHSNGANFGFVDGHAKHQPMGSLLDKNWDVRCSYGQVCQGAPDSPPYPQPDGTCGNQSPIDCQ